jgi:hypothetical protein
MIIWGSRGRERIVAQGDFFCPSCKMIRRFTHHEVAKYFTLYFIPLFQTSKLGEYVQCATCLTTYKPEVLSLTRAYLDEVGRQTQLDNALAELEKKLDAGLPLQALAQGLVKSGLSEEMAASVLFRATHGHFNSCPACGAKYKSTLQFCSACGTQLTPG